MMRVYGKMCRSRTRTGGKTDFVLGMLCVFCLLAAVMPMRLLGMLLAAALAHEAGHLLIMVLTGVPVGGCAVRWGGAVLYGDFSRVSYLREAAVHLGGPAVNLLLCAAAAWAGSMEPAACNLLLALYSLLPLSGHDGMHAITAFLRACGWMGGGLLRILRDAAAAVMLLFSGWILWYGALSDPEGVSFVYGGLFFCVLGGLYGRAAPDLRGKNKMDI